MPRAHTPTQWLAVSIAILSLVLAACGQQPAAPAKPAAEPTKPAAAAPAATSAPAAKTTEAAKPAEKPAEAQPTAAGPAPAAKVSQSGVATTKAPANKRDLVVVTPADISKLDPQMSTSVNDITIQFNLFDNLTTRDPDLNLIPQLATEWKTTGELTWEFKLRPGVKFHNGDPLTSK